ncbi:MAG: dTDP-glucose 4,6-dehydratase [Candidatus Velamenicoccus archaeovorus]
MSPAAEPTHVLVTGGAGFIGSHLVDRLLEEPQRRVTVLDRLSTGGRRENLARHEGDPRFRFVLGDVNDPTIVDGLVREVDAVVHCAAETHVDRSIAGPREFLVANVLGTQTVLEACREHRRRLLMVSTDEVYGANEPDGEPFAEDGALRPRSPYAASKAAADLLCTAYHETYGLDVTIVRGTNAFGPRQLERVVPTYALAALRGEPVPVYGRGEQRREFLHVVDWVRAAELVLERGDPGLVYNIGGGFELANLELARRICALAGAPGSLIAFVPDRPGHDFRYGVRPDRLRALGWAPEVPFDEGLASTVAWYREHLDEVLAATPVPAR